MGVLRLSVGKLDAKQRLLKLQGLSILILKEDLFVLRWVHEFGHFLILIFHILPPIYDCNKDNFELPSIKVKSIGGMCILIQMWAWERCTTLAPKRTPPVIENKPLGHRFVVKKITFEFKIFNDGTCWQWWFHFYCRWLRRGNQHIGNDDLRVFRRKLDLMKRHEVRRS